MARPVWSGTVILDKVAVPISLFVAHDRDEISYKTLHRACGTPIKQKTICPHDGAELESGDKVKGFEFSPRQFVLVDGPEFQPPASKEITLEQVTPLAEISPLHLDTTYRIAPADDEASARAYGVLTTALARTNMGGVGKLTMYGKERTCLIRSADGALVLTTLFLRREIRAAEVAGGAIDEREVKLAARLLNTRATKFDPDKVAGTPGKQIQKLLDAKIAAGETIASPDAAIAPVDLAAALRDSVRPKPRTAARKR
jgi:DNA end-binding protein Ku